MIVLPGNFSEQSRHLADLMVKAQLPAMFYRREQVELGGLEMSYGTSYIDMYRRAAAMWTRFRKVPAQPISRWSSRRNSSWSSISRPPSEIGLTIPPILLARPMR